MPLAQGQTFAGYRILRRVGSGGMGEVYLVQHPRLPRKDALKVLASELSANAEYRARFNREADLASELYHPHIVGVHDRGEDDGQLWISMDYVDGLDAARLLADEYRQGMPLHQVAEIVTAVAGALDYAHSRGLTHRDVKPANIMLTNDTTGQRILLADFGIAHSLHAINSLTATGYTVGTVAYAAPEQLLGQEVDGRADQYALAATAYHLLTGSHLFPHSLVEKPTGDAGIDSVLAIALAKTPNARFSRCQDFARALADHSSGEESPSPVAPTRPARVAPTPTRPSTEAPQQAVPSTGGFRRRWLAPMAALAALLLASVIALAWNSSNKGQSTATTTSSAPPPVVTSASPSAPPPPPPPPPTFPANAIDSVLLGPADIAAATGSTGPPLEVSRPADYPIWTTLTPASCSNVMFNAQRVADPNSGVVAERSGKYARSSASKGCGPANVEESVLVFASAGEAQTMFSSSQAQWRSCASNEVTVGYGEDSWTYKFGEVQFHGDVSSVSMAAGSVVEVGSRACQTAIGLRANVVVETWTCVWAEFPYFPATPADPNAAGDYAVQLATAMLNNVKV